MILRLLIENFLSFRESTSFDMFPNLKRTIFNSHIYDMEIPLLKQTAIYGANGSGKSNFIKAVRFIKDFVVREKFLNNQNIAEFGHKLDNGNFQKPISIIVEFFTAQKYFIYQMEVSQKGIDKEALYLSGIGEKENELIFLRIFNTVEFTDAPSDEIQKIMSRTLEENPFSSLMSLNHRFPFIPSPLVGMAFNWFYEELQVVTFNATAIGLIDYMDHNPDMLNFANEIFSKIDLGIKDLTIHTESFEEWVGKNEHKIYEENARKINVESNIAEVGSNIPLFSISLEKGIKKVKEFAFNQLGKDGYVGELGIGAQSDGTVRLLMLVPAIYEAIKSGHTVFVDEIDHSIHPILVRALVRYFSDTETKGQLIFTTHETCLLNQQCIMRPDEVWFTEKQEGATRIYSLNDFKEHHTISIENGYMQGRYGAIPFIGELGEMDV